MIEKKTIGTDDNPVTVTIRTGDDIDGPMRGAWMAYEIVVEFGDQKVIVEGNHDSTADFAEAKP